MKVRKWLAIVIIPLLFFSLGNDWPPPDEWRPSAQVTTWDGGSPINAGRPGTCRGTFIGEPGDGCFGFPVPEYARWISGYVFRDWRYLRHNGLDFGLWYGGPVYAADDGVVLFCGWWGGNGYGNMVVLDHLNGWQTWYAHLSVVEVECGEWVPEGKVIGRGGSSGWSTGAHLHFEVRFEGIPIDPMDVLPW